VRGTSHSISVLYVDDEPDARELVAARLEAESDRLTVGTEATAATALDRFDEGDVDCIVSDYHLEETDGVAFLEAVRAEAPDIPFVMLTRTGSEETASAAISAGVTDYVIKGLADAQYELLAEKITGVVDRRRAEQAAARTERLLQELTEQTNDVLWMFAADWSETLFVNSAYEELFGEGTDRIDEDPTAFLGLVHPDDRDALRRAMDRVADGESVRITYRVQPGPDLVRWVESHGEPVYEDGEVARIAGFSRDITARKRAEEELRRKNEELDTFTSVVAHDLRNPLNVAKGYLEILDGKTDADEIAPIERSLDRMQQLVTDLLTLAREGDVTDESRRVELGDLAREHWQTVPTDGATLEVGDPVSVVCDPERLGQALENLFRNAVEHGSTSPDSQARQDAVEHTDGEVTVTVGRIESTDGFYVEDDGPGIPDDERARLLAEGRNVDSETGEVSLGLSIVERIVEAHGWSVGIADRADGGARFEITGVESIETGT
jgi:PAS domain S-box-containing protein